MEENNYIHYYIVIKCNYLYIDLLWIVNKIKKVFGNCWIIVWKDRQFIETLNQSKKDILYIKYT